MKNFLKNNYIALGILFFAVLFVVLGLLQNDFQTVRQKGSMICTQCVGFK